jgi:acetoin:2,6-dichlorophenolindophenol oxidoreductase subunit alpha
MQKGTLSLEKLKWTYGCMTLMREFDERVQRDFLAGKLTGALHVYCGEEAIAAGVCANLIDSDYIVGTHRSHGHAIAKGLDIKAIMAELHGKATGLCHGKGGSMHIGDLRLGMLGANGIVAAGLPLACGAALTAKVKQTGGVAVAFFGDGACNAGAFHEALNLAAVLELPVVFVLENNEFADATHISYSAKIKDLCGRASAYGIPGFAVDGTDVFSVIEKAGELIQRARKDNLPSLLECKTFRYYGHYVGDAGSYRTKDQLEEYRKTDCIKRFEERVVKHNLMTEDTLSEIRARSAQLVNEAVAYAESSPLPQPKECLDDVYVSY